MTNPFYVLNHEDANFAIQYHVADPAKQEYLKRFNGSGLSIMTQLYLKHMKYCVAQPIQIWRSL